MAREKFQTLTEPMFYILLALRHECCGVDIMKKIKNMTNNRVIIGPGTLYTLLSSFAAAGLIRETIIEGRKRSYIINDTGIQLLQTEYTRMHFLVDDYRKY